MAVNNDDYYQLNEKRLATFFASAPDAIIVINDQQKILEWNPKAETIFGFSASEVKGLELSQTIIPPQYREAHRRGMKHFLETGVGPVLNKTIEITALNKNGKEFYVNLSISSVKMENEWLFIAFLSDISDRKKMEEKLIRKEAELLQSKILEDKKDEFISIASHELKTPLTTIKAYAQLAVSQTEGISEPVKNFLIKIDEYTVKLNYLVNELLDVSKITAGKLKLSQTVINFNIFLEEILSSIQHIVPTYKILIKRNDEVSASVDLLRIEQVFTNLISNAAKYSPGKNTIIVRSELVEGKVRVSVTDFGIGIPKENFSMVFTRFFRVDDASKSFGGLGIGLFISSEIIKQHGGEIWVESKVGEGSTFYFTLPLINS